MFPLTKLIGAFLTFPGFIVTFFLIAALLAALRRKKEGRFYLIIALTMYLFSSSWFSYYLSRILSVPDTADRGAYIVVLGGGVDHYGAITEIGKQTLRRLYKGFELYQRQHRKIVVTGGVVSKGIPEGDLMKKVLLTWGVPERDIIMENRSRNTYENARFVRNLVGDVPVTVVTSTLHMRRSLWFFKRYFSRVDHVQADVPVGFQQVYLDYLPSGGAFYAWCEITHELAGLVAYPIVITTFHSGE